MARAYAAKAPKRRCGGIRKILLHRAGQSPFSMLLRFNWIKRTRHRRRKQAAGPAHPTRAFAASILRLASSPHTRLRPHLCVSSDSGTGAAPTPKAASACPQIGSSPPPPYRLSPKEEGRRGARSSLKVLLSARCSLRLCRTSTRLHAQASPAFNQAIKTEHAFSGLAMAAMHTAAVSAYRILCQF